MEEPAWEEIGRLTEENIALRSSVARLEEALKEIKQRAEFMNWGSVAKIASRALEEK